MSNFPPFRVRIAVCLPWLAAAGLVAGSLSAHAQSQTPAASSSSPTSQSSGSWWNWTRASDGSFTLIPFTRRGYVGVNLGRPDYGRGNCAAGFSCNDPDVGVTIYTGGLLTEYFGAEVGYVALGNADRAGGSADAQGIRMSLVGRLPIGPVNVFIKGGGLYGRTKVTASALSGVPRGTASGWGKSYGAGAGFDFTPQHGIVVEWARHNFDTPRDGGVRVDLTSVGYLFRF